LANNKLDLISSTLVNLPDVKSLALIFISAIALVKDVLKII